MKSFSRVSQDSQNNEPSSSSSSSSSLSFSPAQVKLIKRCFERFAYRCDLMDKARFRASLGILSMDTYGFLSDRLFDLIDEDRDGIIHFIDFVRYLDIVMNKDQFERAKLGFRFVDIRNKGKIFYEDIQQMVSQVTLFWKELTGSTVVPSKEHIDEIFLALDAHTTGEVSLGDFYNVYCRETCPFKWFELFNQEDIAEQQKQAETNQQEVVKEQLSAVKAKTNTALKNIEEELEDLIIKLAKLSAAYNEKEFELKKRQEDRINMQKIKEEDKSNTMQMIHLFADAQYKHTNDFRRKGNQHQQSSSSGGFVGTSLPISETKYNLSPRLPKQTQPPQQSQLFIRPSNDFSTADSSQLARNSGFTIKPSEESSLPLVKSSKGSQKFSGFDQSAYNEMNSMRIERSERRGWETSNPLGQQVTNARDQIPAISSNRSSVQSSGWQQVSIVESENSQNNGLSSPSPQIQQQRRRSKIFETSTRGNGGGGVSAPLSSSDHLQLKPFRQRAPSASENQLNSLIPSNLSQQNKSLKNETPKLRDTKKRSLLGDSYSLFREHMHESNNTITSSPPQQLQLPDFCSKSEIIIYLDSNEREERFPRDQQQQKQVLQQQQLNSPNYSRNDSLTSSNSMASEYQPAESSSRVITIYQQENGHQNRENREDEGDSENRKKYFETQFKQLACTLSPQEEADEQSEIKLLEGEKQALLEKFGCVEQRIAEIIILIQNNMKNLQEALVLKPLLLQNSLLSLDQKRIKPDFEQQSSLRKRESTVKNMAVLNEKSSSSSSSQPASGANCELPLIIGHEHWDIILQMMLVIRSAVKSLKKINHPALGKISLTGGGLNTVNNNQQVHVETLQYKDFELRQQSLLFNTTSQKSSQLQIFEYIDYAPLVFESIRQKHGITQESLLRSLGPENFVASLIMGRISNITELCRSQNSPNTDSNTGSSLKLFYYSECGQFIVQTVSERRAMQLLKMLPDYYAHITKQHDSLLMKVFGLYKLQIREDVIAKRKKRSSYLGELPAGKSEESSRIFGGQVVLETLNKDAAGQLGYYLQQNPLWKSPVYFMISSNVFNTNAEVKQRFELKGSTRGRKTTAKENSENKIPKKDLDWIDTRVKMRISQGVRQELLAQIQRDCSFLASHNLINYCMLVGLAENHERGGGGVQQDRQKVSGVKTSKLSRIASIDGRRSYLLGIINFLNEYTTSKKWIAMIKNPFLGKTQSTVDPKTYSDRLLTFFDLNVLE